MNGLIRSFPSSVPSLLFMAGMAAVLVLFLSGCQTVERRIAQNPELFESFDPEDQELIRQGKVAVGFTPEMVEIAWGRPDRRKTVRTEAEEIRIWEYVARRSVYDGRRFTGYRHDVFFDPRTEKRRTVWRPVYVDTYRTTESEVGRVEFRDGKVAAVTTVE